MRINKQVERILKLTVVTSMTGAPFSLGADATVSDETYDEWDRWFSNIVNEFVGDPLLDTIAAQWGTTADSILDRLTIQGYLIYAEEIAGERSGTEAGYRYDINQMVVEVPMWVFKTNNRMEVLQAMFHEFEHAARSSMGLIGAPLSYVQGEYGRDAMWTMIGDEQEHTAIMAQMADMLAMGYNDNEIITYILDRQFKGEPEVQGMIPWYEQYLVAREHQLVSLLERTKREYGVFL